MGFLGKQKSKPVLKGKKKYVLRDSLNKDTKGGPSKVEVTKKLCQQGIS